MAYDGVIDDVRRAIGLEKPKRLPVFACSEECDVRWHGKYTYEEVCSDGAKIAEVWIAAIEEFDYDWAWMQVDDCFEFEPLGVGTHGEGNILRATRDYLPATKETLQNLRMPNPQADGRMPEKLKAIRLVKERFGDTVLVEGSCAGPLQFGGPVVRAGRDDDAHGDRPGFPGRSVRVLRRAANPVHRGPARRRGPGHLAGRLQLLLRLSLPGAVPHVCLSLVQEAGREMQAAGAIVHLMNSEIKLEYLLAEAELGVDIVNCGPGADIAAVRAGFTGKTCFSGNLDPIEVLMRGTPEEVAREAERIVKIGASAGGYLFCTGEMNPRDTPAENMKAMIEAVRKCSSP